MLLYYISLFLFILGGGHTHLVWGSGLLSPGIPLILRDENCWGFRLCPVIVIACAMPQVCLFYFFVLFCIVLQFWFCFTVLVVETRSSPFS